MAEASKTKEPRKQSIVSSTDTAQHLFPTVTVTNQRPGSSHTLPPPAAPPRQIQNVTLYVSEEMSNYAGPLTIDLMVISPRAPLSEESVQVRINLVVTGLRVNSIGLTLREARFLIHQLVGPPSTYTHLRTPLAPEIFRTVDLQSHVGNITVVVIKDASGSLHLNLDNEQKHQFSRALGRLLSAHKGRIEALRMEVQ